MSKNACSLCAVGLLPPWCPTALCCGSHSHWPTLKNTSAKDVCRTIILIGYKHNGIFIVVVCRLTASNGFEGKDTTRGIAALTIRIVYCAFRWFGGFLSFLTGRTGRTSLTIQTSAGNISLFLFLPNRVQRYDIRISHFPHSALFFPFLPLYSLFFLFLLLCTLATAKIQHATKVLWVLAVLWRTCGNITWNTYIKKYIGIVFHNMCFYIYAAKNFSTIVFLCRSSCRTFTELYMNCT